MSDDRDHDINEKHAGPADAIRRAGAALLAFFGDDPESDGLKGCVSSLVDAALMGLEWRSRVGESQEQSKRCLDALEEQQAEGRRLLALVTEATSQSEAYNRLADEQRETIAVQKKALDEQAALLEAQATMLEGQAAMLAGTTKPPILN